MKTRLHIFTTAFLVLLHLIPMHAMENSAVEPKYQLVGIAKKQGINGNVTLVKQISDRYLVVHNKHGIGLLFDLKENFNCIKQWKFGSFGSVFCLNNVFLCLDPVDGKPLLIAHDLNSSSLYVYSLDSECDYGPIYIESKFKIAPAMVDAKKTLVMINTEDNSAFYVGLTCATTKEMYKSDYEDLFPMQRIDSFCIDDVIDEGLLVNSRTYQDCFKQFLLPSRIFDIKSLTEEEKKWAVGCCLVLNGESFKDICSYHKTLDGTLHLGDDHGVVSVWCPKNK